MTNVFSPTENKVLKILGKKNMTITQIVKEFYKDQAPPVTPNNVIASAVRQINRKCNYHKLAWFLNGEGLGRGGKQVWKDKKDYPSRLI